MGETVPITQAGDAGCFPGAHLTWVWRKRALAEEGSVPGTDGLAHLYSPGRTSPVCPLPPQWTDGPPPVQFQAQNGPNTSLASLL